MTIKPKVCYYNGNEDMIVWRFGEDKHLEKDDIVILADSPYMLNEDLWKPHMYKRITKCTDMGYDEYQIEVEDIKIYKLKYYESI